jgi:hypothetical protein
LGILVCAEDQAPNFSQTINATKIVATIFVAKFGKKALLGLCPKLSKLELLRDTLTPATVCIFMHL